MKGIPDLIISSIIVPGGATLFITNKDMPKGGDSSPTSILIRNTTAHQTGLKPRAWTMGINIGSVIIIMGTCPINMPRNIRTICINMLSTNGFFHHLPGQSFIGSRQNEHAECASGRCFRRGSYPQENDTDNKKDDDPHRQHIVDKGYDLFK